MTEENQPPGSTLENPILNEDIGGDEILQLIISTADDNAESFNVGVTLAVNGSLVTGTLVGHDKWFRELEIQYAELRVPLTTPFRKQLVDERQPEGDTDPIEVRYVHLKDARYLQGNTYVPKLAATGFFWRGRISHVSAWSFGVISGTPG